MKRGEIYYIAYRETIGAEIAKARPGVVVSNDAQNTQLDVVEVVYLTTNPRQDIPTHVSIKATGRPSMTLCEQIDTVSVELVGDFCGVCSPEEMAAIEHALLRSLGMHRTPDPVNHPGHYNTGRIEVIDFIEDQRLNFNLGNVVKYTARAGKKDAAKTVEDLKKAAFYLDREIKRLRGGGEE